MNQVTAVVVHYGDLAPTVRVASSVASYGAETVVVANDGAERPPGLDPAVEWLVPPRNLGYGSAFMFASRGRSTPVFAVLNTDIVFSRASFWRCAEALSADRVGVAGPVLRRVDGSLQSGAARLTRWRRAPNVRVDPGPSAVDCAWVCGAAMFVRREVLEQIGMDGSYFLGGEDADLCVRARRAGWRVVCCGDAPAIHHGSQVISGPRWCYYAVRNRVWFARANFGVLAAALSWLHAGAMLPRVAVADLVKRRDLTSSRLSALGLAHAWWRKPVGDPRLDEPIPSQVMRW